MKEFHASGSYQTEGGNIGAFGFRINAPDFDAAMLEGERRIKSDKRRRYARSLEISVSEIVISQHEPILPIHPIPGLAHKRNPICAHSYKVASYGGRSCIITYRCEKCGDEYEKDVS